MTEEKTQRKEIKSPAARGVLFACLSFLFFAIVALQLFVWVLAGWLGTEAGARFLNAQVNTLLQDSGYRAELVRPSFPSPREWRLEQIVLTDAAGGRIEIAQAAARLSILPLVRGKLSLSLFANTVAMVRGEGRGPSSPVALSGFSLPQMPLRAARLSLHVRDFAGQPLQAVLDVARAEEEVAFEINMAEPVAVQALGGFDPAALALRIVQLSIDTPAARFSGAARAALAGVDTMFDVAGTLAVADDSLSTFDVALEVKDVMNAPAGMLKAEGLLQQSPLALSMAFSLENEVTAKDISAAWNGHSLTGEAAWNAARSQARGRFVASFAPAWGGGRIAVNLEDGHEALLTLQKGVVRHAGVELRRAVLALRWDETLDNIHANGSLRLFYNENIDVTFKGAARGVTSSPAIKAQAQITAPAFKGFLLDVAGDYADGAGVASFTGKGPGIRKLEGESLFMPLTASIVADLDAARLSRLFLPATMDLAGKIDVAATFAEGAASGTAKLSGGRFSDEASGLDLRNIALRAVFSGDSLTIESLTARDAGDGVVEARGTLGLGAGNPADLSLRARDIDPFATVEAVDGRLTLDVSLRGRRGEYLLQGDVTAETLSINIPERINDDIPRLNITRRGEKREKPLSEGIALDVRVSAPQRVFVRGWGLDAEFGGDLRARGTLAAPEVDGTLKSLRGTYREFGKRFELARANLRFQGAVPPSPYLDIVAETASGGVTAQVLLTGSVGAPKVGFSAVPALPEDEVLARILFGRDTARISPFQAVELANTLRRLSGKGGGPSPLDALRGATGLDDLSVERGDDGQTTVGAGKYITDKVYVQMQSGTGEKAGAARVRIDLTPDIKAETIFSQDAKTGGSLMWSRDY